MIFETTILSTGRNKEEVMISFNYEVTLHVDREAVTHLSPEDCCPAEFEFQFDVTEVKIDCGYDEVWMVSCDDEAVNELICSQCADEVLDHYLKNKLH